MRKLLLLFILLCPLHKPLFAHQGIWQKAGADGSALKIDAQYMPETYEGYILNLQALKAELAKAAEGSTSVVPLPMADGSTLDFKIWETSVLAKPLTDKYPEIKTYAGVAINNPLISARLDITYTGFHAMIKKGSETSFVNPSANAPHNNHYIAFDRRAYKLPPQSAMTCLVQDGAADVSGKEPVSLTPSGLPQMQLKENGGTIRTYRLALAATVEYSTAVGGPSPTKATVLSAMVTTINRVNSVFEADLSVTLQLIGNTDDLIYLNHPDPYSNGSGATMLTQNQTNIDNVIGNANYDIGHVFSTGGGGIADLGCVCNDQYKARGVTGRNNPVGDPFDLDYVAHEIGHQFGASHTFNASSGSCNGNIVPHSAYEPGSGSTIMAYAGICAGNNVADAGSAYFHGISLDQITDYLNGFSGGSCGTYTPSGNVPAVVPPYGKTYYIPYKTPFELTAPEAIDTDHDLLTYCWEQFDLGDVGASFNATQKDGPIFRSFDPTVSRTRVFPTLEKLIHNQTNYLGEKLPEVARQLTFRVTVRDVLNGFGAFNFPNEAIILEVVNTGRPFEVRAPNSKDAYWRRNNTATVEWEVASTSAAPINCSNVDILLSLDDGHSYSYVLATNTPNDGIETITVPDVATASARVKVKGSGNVFFDISNEGFIINNWPESVPQSPEANRLKLYPVPASDRLKVELNDDAIFSMTITNALGQQVYSANINKQAEVMLSGWAPGIYHILLLSAEGERIVRPFVVE